MRSIQRIELLAAIVLFVVCAGGLVRHWPTALMTVLFVLLVALLFAPWLQMRRTRQRL